MLFLVILLGVGFLSHCCALSVSDEHSKIESDPTSGAMMDSPLTPLPQIEIRQIQGNYPFSPLASGYRPQRCPLCDSSIYPYCGEKLLHDACCCTNSHDLPYQCKVADCRFLHANSCREHRLIANCCCNDDYRAVLKNLEQA
ncbi:uncharacterized protein [Linepithema humile]|uniref:uncharacterized protein n=1 Tax=Linepithema humile TaxID=83485 RepID=UPI0006234F48|nr:PREDICTED: uncharacterized protein LOC105677408 [Linepithema humile]